MLDAQKREAFASLSSLFKSRKNEIPPSSLRPPYVVQTSLLESVCVSCVDTPCIKACEEEIIVLDEKHIPSLVFTKRGCTFCEECAVSCPSGVLHVNSSKRIHALFRIDTKTCIAWQNVICNSCADVCDVKAITFFGMLRPLLDKELCTRCGFCYGVCPSNAVHYQMDSKGV
jgi:ferredoxin-type protein NapF